MALMTLCMLSASVCCTRSQAGRGGTQSRAPSFLDLPPDEFIYVGMEVPLMKQLVGEPSQVEESPLGQIWYYAFGSVIVKEQRVIYKYPPSRRDTVGGSSVPQGVPVLESPAAGQE